jgi:hypothetical protein
VKQAVPSHLERAVAWLTTGGTPDEYVDLVQATTVDENGGRMTIDVIEPPAKQRAGATDAAPPAAAAEEAFARAAASPAANAASGEFPESV